MRTVPACVNNLPNTCTPYPESVEQCSDGVDNDCDTFIDSADPDCAPLPDVPSWASWAARPVGVSVAQNSGNVNVDISGFDFVWSRGYRSNANVLLAGPPFSASSVWLPFNVNAGSNVVDDGWIRASNSVLSTTIPSDSFVVNSQRFNAVVLYACKYLGRTSEFFEYDCNGIDGKTVKIKPDHTYHQDSGRGSWLLTDFEKS